MSAAVEEIWKVLSSIPLKSSFKFNRRLKEYSLGSCRGDLGLPELSSMQILIEIQLLSKGNLSRQL